MCIVRGTFHDKSTQAHILPKLLLVTSRTDQHRGSAAGAAGATVMGEVIQPVEFHTDHWPAPMTDDAFHGLAGEIINTIAPHSEADKNGLLVQLLVAVGNAIGGTPYCPVESNYHRCNLFVCQRSGYAGRGCGIGHPQGGWCFC
jgi:hypothetical protein